jgi:hypothetical protein
MMGGMGYRVIRLELSTAPSDWDLSLLRQAVAFARFNKIGAFLTLPKRYPAVLEVTIEANSSFLNDFTSYFNDSITQIASDIDPNNESLRSITAAMASQLNAQIVDWSGVPTVVLARRGRELEERVAGDSSFRQIGVELGTHAKRIRGELAKYQKAAGPSRFDQKAPHLVDLRNIAEHIDEYSIGHGRHDAFGLEPGDVFRLDVNGERLTLTARQRTVDVLTVYEACQSLIECLVSAINHHTITHLFPPIADFDFVAYTETGTEIIARSDEPAAHSAARTQLASVMSRTIRELPATRCPECNHWL